MPKIFISYRREDSSYPAGAIARHLAVAFGEGEVVLDVDNIPPGQDFRDYIKAQLEACDYLIAVIGKSWLTACDKSGRPRLENPNDWVRLELEAALGRGSRIPVIPVLLDNIPPPTDEQLPDSLKELAYRQAHSIRPPTDFDHDVEKLIQKIKGQERARNDAEQRGIQARPPKQSAWLRRPWALWSAAAIVAVVAVLSMAIALTRRGEGLGPGETTNPAPKESLVESRQAAASGNSVSPATVNDLGKKQATVEATAIGALPSTTRGDSASPPVGNDLGKEPVTITAGGQFLINSIGMKLTLIPAGEFLMGAANGEKEATSDEKPQHRVHITKPFYCGVYEVTQTEFERVTGRNPSVYCARGTNREKVAGLDTSRFPVENVSWADAVDFCNKLSEREKRQPCYHFINLVRREDGSVKEVNSTPQEGNGYRLPTEAEWEYACRAGTTIPFHFGASLNGIQANCDGTKPYGTDEKGASLLRPTTVGSYAPNAFGLYDMHGNVWEWCWDWYDTEYYKKSTKSDPLGPPDTLNGTMEVMRGGAWYSGADSCRAAHRGHDEAANKYGDTGFRVLRVR